MNGYLLDNGRCYSACISYGLVPDTSTGVCVGCDTSCLTCYNNKYNCTSCNISSIYRYFLNNRCLDTCPNSYYNDSIFNICIKCTAPC